MKPPTPRRRMKQCFVRLLLAVAIVAMAVPQAGAQQAPRRLGLAEALEIALRENYGLQIATRQVDIARRSNHPSLAGRYPTLDLLLSDNNRLQQIDNPASFINGTFQNIGLNGQVQLNWVLFDGWRVSLTQERLQQLQFLAEGSEQVAIQNTVQAVILTYYTAQFERQRLLTLEEAVRVSEQRLRTEDDRRSLGAGTGFDLEQARANYYNDRRNAQIQQQNHRQAVLALHELLNLDATQLVELTDPLPDPPAPPPHPPQAQRERLRTRNPHRRNEYINYEILKRDYDLARAVRLPSVNLNAGTGYTLSRIKINDFEPRTGTTIDYFANFTLSWRLFQGGAIRRQIENSAVQQEIGRLSIDRARQGLEVRLETAWQDYLTRFEAWKLSQQALAAQRRVLETAAERLRVGTITTLDFRNFQLQAIQAEFALIEAQHRLALADVELLRLTGGIVR